MKSQLQTRAETKRANSKRAGFTLIELLVVIAIIAILISLMAAGVMTYLSRATDARNASDINQLATAAGNFKTKFGMYPPSKIKLWPRLKGTPGSDYETDTDPLAKISRTHLLQMWPRLNDTATHNWAGNSTSVTYPIVLEGHECLVFFLGGIPDVANKGCLGFSTSPTTPTMGSQERIQPFYSFESGRLAPRPGGGDWPFAYLDVWEGALTRKPYAYFSSGKRPNQYNAPPVAPFDCAGIGAGPYLQPGSTPTLTRFHNPDTFQIVSAGRDQLFGGGGTWDPNNPPQGNTPGHDDRTNFCANILGAGN